MKIDIKINNLTFFFKDTKEEVFSDFSIIIPSQKKVAIIGRSGCGKSTLLKLILGLYRPTKGEIELLHEGHILPNKKNTTYMGYVPQKNVLFPGTIKENIVLNQNTIEMFKIKKAASLACCDHLIEQLPQKYNTIIGESTSRQFSGGEIQRLAIARAILQDTPILILDEFTSALDDDTEEKVINNIFSLPKTILTVAHKQSVINKCDYVIDLDKLCR